MLGKKYARVGLWTIPLVALALAACNKHTAANPSAAGNTSSPATPTPNAQIDPATAGSVSGTIRFNGKAPTPIVIDMAQDPACSEGSKTPNMTEQYVVHDDRLANVFVYVKDGLGNRIYMPTKTPVVLDQKGCRYIPTCHRRDDWATGRISQQRSTPCTTSTLFRPEATTAPASTFLKRRWRAPNNIFFAMQD